MIKRWCGCAELHVSNQTKLQETKQNALSIPPLSLLSSGCLPPPLFLFSPSPFIIWRGKESPPGHFYNPAIPPPPISAPPFPTLLLPIRSSESLSTTPCTYTFTHMHIEFLLTPIYFTHTHTFIFCALHFKHMKGCSVGTKAKGRVGRGVRRRNRRERGRGIKAVLQSKMYRKDGGGGDPGGERRGSHRPHWSRSMSRVSCSSDLY